MLKTVSALCLSAFMLSVAVPGHAAEKIKFTLGWQPTMNAARFFVADAKGLFAENDLDVNLIKFTSGPSFFAAFQSSSIDVGFLGLQPAATAIAQDIPVKVFAVENDAGGAEGLVARSDSGIKKIADLRGRKVGTKRGTSSYSALLAGLKTAGMQESDIQLVDLDITSLVPAFSKGDIEAAWFYEPWMGLLKRQNGTVIATDSDINFPIGIMWAARTAWMKDNPEALSRLFRVLDQAADLIHTEPKEMAKLIAPRLGLTEEHVYDVLTTGGKWPTNAESASEGYKFSMSPTLIAAGKGLAGMMNDSAEVQKEAKIIQKVPDFAKEIDPQPLALYLAKK